MKEQLDHMKKLIEILNNASKQYYQFNTSIMTDFEYDKLYNELLNLEKETNITLSNSPTINIETEILSSLEQYQHSTMMLSLDKTKDIEQFVEFLGDKEGVLSWKLDGLTIVITYENGKLVRGVTRGTGTIGEVVTENIKRFKNIPLTIPYEGTLVVRGEAVITYSDFNNINNEIDDETNQYKNPRNLCSGSVRQLNSNITAKRNVKFVVFTLINSDKIISNSKLKQYKWLKSLGFEVVEHFCVNKRNLIEKVEKFKNNVKKYDIPSDGLVLTYDDEQYSINLGNTSKHPRHSLAFKWKDETVQTKLISVDWNVSRTGLINPIAVFESVKIEGTQVSKASLHNISILKSLKLGIGDDILVYKANMIIPQIANNITKSNSLNIPKICPACNCSTKIKQSNDVQYLYCTNEYCVAKLLKKLSLFTSRKAMNIEGLSDAILSKLINNFFVKNYSDIYKLDKYKDKILSFEGFGKKSYDNLINSINKSRNVKLHNFIYALGIPEIGLSRAKIICNNFNNNYKDISQLTYNDLKILPGIGETIAKEWIATFENKKFITEVNKVVKEIIFIDNDRTNEAKFKDYSFVITGSVNQFKNRNALIQFIETYEGKVVNSISTKVNYLINNDVTSNSSKNKKAKKLGIKIISEETLLQLVNIN